MQDMIETSRESVVVRDVNMSFISMVKFMVKWAIASIPAFLILMFILGICGSVMMGILRGIM